MVKLTRAFNFAPKIILKSFSAGPMKKGPFIICMLFNRKERAFNKLEASFLANDGVQYNIKPYAKSLQSTKAS